MTIYWWFSEPKFLAIIREGKRTLAELDQLSYNNNSSIYEFQFLANIKSTAIPKPCIDHPQTSPHPTRNVMSEALVHIRSTQSQSTPSGAKIFCFTIDVVYQVEPSLSKSYTVEELIPWTPEDQSEMAWYLQDHIQKDPFSERRAQTIRSSLATLGDTLVRKLKLDQHFAVQPRSGDSHRVIQIDIHDNGTGDNSLQKLPWEVLESKELLKPYPWIHVSVMRAIHIPPPSVLRMDCSSPRLNILLVVARPSGRDDVEYRSTMLPFVEIMKEMPPSAIHLDIVRPGTWSAFKNALKSVNYGYYHVVHFDLHGRASRDRYVAP